MKKLFLILVILSAVLQISGQDVAFKAETKSPVREGERFRLIYSVNAEGQNFNAPKIKGFRVLSGPNRSSQSSIQIINGKVTRSVNYEYYYTLQALEEGSFELSPASIDVEGETYYSNQVTIRVEKGNPPQSSSSQQGSVSQENIEGIDEDYAFLRAEVSDANPLLGEQVIVTYKLYYRVNITDYAISQSPSYPGCWSQDITEDKQPTQQTSMVNGKRYRVAEIYREAIFPQKTGEIVTGPMEFQIAARVKDNSRRSRDPFESFFDDSFFGGRAVQRKLQSNPLTLNVKPLPANGKPATFEGAVGDFELSSTIDKKEILVNDAITLNIKISGKGNIKLIDAPDINFPPDFEVYDPEVTTDIHTSSVSGISGSKTFKYLIIPRVAGTYKIRSKDFSFFDINARQYKTIDIPEYTINVKKGDQQASQGITIRSGAKQDIQYLGEDIRYIKTDNLNLRKRGDLFFRSTTFYLVMGIAFFVLILVLLAYYVLSKRKGNVMLQNEKQATRIARKRLKISKEYLKKGDGEHFYEALSDAIWGYISYKFNIPLSALSVDTVKTKLEDKVKNEDIISEFVETLEACEYARFAPGDKDKKMEELYERAQQVIINTEKELR